MRSGVKVDLTSLDELFSTQESRDDAQRERVVQIPLSELHPFTDHPFRVLDDDKMRETVESVLEHGVVMPALARPRPEGGYELISGHRRHRACQLANLETMPVIVRNLDNDQAIIAMVDSNIQRESLLPSERGRAYRMKMEALKHQGARSDLTSVHNEQKLNARDIVAQDAGASAAQVHRYIRLTYLAPELLELVDAGKFGVTPASEVSYLSESEQRMLIDAMESEQTTPSSSQAKRLKQYSQEGKLTQDILLLIMREEKKVDQDRVTLDHKVLHTYFPRSFTPRQMEDSIVGMLKSRQQLQGYFPKDFTPEQIDAAVSDLVKEHWKRVQNKAKLQQRIRKEPQR